MQPEPLSVPCVPPWLGFSSVQTPKSARSPLAGGFPGCRGGGKAGRLHSLPGRAEICMQRKRSWRDGKENKQPKRLRQPEEQGRAGGWCLPHHQELSPRPRNWGNGVILPGIKLLQAWAQSPAGFAEESKHGGRRAPGSIAGGQALSQYF